MMGPLYQPVISRVPPLHEKMGEKTPVTHVFSAIYRGPMSLHL